MSYANDGGTEHINGNKKVLFLFCMVFPSLLRQDCPTNLHGQLHLHVQFENPLFS